MRIRKKLCCGFADITMQQTVLHCKNQIGTQQLCRLFGLTDLVTWQTSNRSFAALRCNAFRLNSCTSVIVSARVPHGPVYTERIRNRIISPSNLLLCRIFDWTALYEAMFQHSIQRLFGFTARGDVIDVIEFAYHRGYRNVMFGLMWPPNVSFIASIVIITFCRLWLHLMTAHAHEMTEMLINCQGWPCQDYSVFRAAASYYSPKLKQRFVVSAYSIEFGEFGALLES